MKLKHSLLLLGLLLIPGYSMAINTMLEPGIGEDLGGQNYCVVESNLGFVCTKTNNVLVGVGNGGGAYLTSSYWWRDDGLGFYTYNQNNPSQNLQGVITGFTFCEYDFIGNNSIKINNSLYWNNCFTRTYTYDEFKAYLSSHQLKKRAYWSFYNRGGQGGPIFIFDEGAFRVGFGLGSSEYQNLFYGTYGLRNFNLAGDGLNVDYSNVGLKKTPNINLNNSSVIDPRYDAQNIYDSYRKMGYSDVLCKGGFALDDVFGTGNASLSGIVIGSGAGIFDLYNSYPYSFYNTDPLDFVSRYNDWDFEYGFFQQYHDQTEFDNYIGRSRGFVGLFMIKDYYFKGSNFDPGVLKSFCEFSLANDVLIDKSQSPLDIVSDSVNESEINKLIGNIGVIVPNTGSTLDMLLQNLAQSGYVAEDDYYSMLNKGFNVINSIEIPNTEYPGILPTYIIIGFLGFMILYVFKH